MDSQPALQQGHAQWIFLAPVPVPVPVAWVVAWQGVGWILGIRRCCSCCRSTGSSTGRVQWPGRGGVAGGRAATAAAGGGGEGVADPATGVPQPWWWAPSPQRTQWESSSSGHALQICSSTPRHHVPSAPGRACVSVRTVTPSLTRAGGAPHTCTRTRTRTGAAGT